METWTAVALALGLCVALFVPYAIFYMRRGKAHGHTWFTWWKPRGHPDIGPTLDFGRLDRAQTMREGLDIN